AIAQLITEADKAGDLLSQRKKSARALVPGAKILTELKPAISELKIAQKALAKIFAVQEGELSFAVKQGEPPVDLNATIAFIHPESWQARENLKHAGFDPAKPPEKTR